MTSDEVADGRGEARPTADPDPSPSGARDHLAEVNGSRLSPMGQWALYYASLGWWVFPCKAVSKEPATPHGFKDATTDAQTITEWWLRQPNANIGVATGQASRLLVVDVDPAGMQWLAQRAPATLAADTGRGRHLYFALPPLQRIGSRVGVLPGLDARADGGYIVAPPSLHPSGRYYRWVDVEVPDLGRLAPVPPDILQMVTNRQRVESSSQPDNGRLRVAEGHRNDALFRFACRARRLLDDDAATVEAVVRQVNAGYRPPLPTEDVDRILRSAWSQDHADDDVDREADRLRIRREARRRVDAEDALAAFTEPEYRGTLAEELAVSDEPLAWQVQGLLPVGANAVLTAMYKTGKTVLGLNLAAALADGTPLFGALAVQPVERRVGFLNYEVSERQMRVWWRDLGISRPDRVSLVNLRGYTIPLTAGVGEDFIVRWAEDCRVEYLIADPWGRAIVGSADENDNSEVRRVLDVLDRIKRRSGITGLLVSTHTGRGEMEEGRERARGATALDDWCDVRLVLTRTIEGQRHLSAEGRDVAFPESPLRFDPETRRLSLGELGLSRQRERDERGVQRVVELVASHPGVARTALSDLLGGHASNAFKTINNAVREGLIVVRRDGRTMRHYLKDSKVPKDSE